MSSLADDSTKVHRSGFSRRARQQLAAGREVFVLAVAIFAEDIGRIE
jgi:hypothetical protein